MQTFDQLSARLLLMLALGLPLATLLCGSETCLAQDDHNAEVTNGKKLFVRKIDIDLKDARANKVALAAMKTKCGGEFNRDAIASDLKGIFAALSKHWNSAGIKQPPENWMYNLRAKPTKSGDNGVNITISISALMKTTSMDLDRFEYQAMPPIFKDSFPKVRTDGSYANRVIHDTGSYAPWHKSFAHSQRNSSACRLQTTAKGQQHELQEFLDGKSDCFAGYDADANF